jgi:sulfur carrier protein
MKLRINGEEREFDRTLTAAGLLAELGIGVQGTAVIRDGNVITPADYATTPLEDGDDLDLVRMVGGG